MIRVTIIGSINLEKSLRPDKKVLPPQQCRERQALRIVEVPFILPVAEDIEGTIFRRCCVTNLMQEVGSSALWTAIRILSPMM